MTLATLIAQRDDLQRQIDALEAERRADVIAQAHAALKALGLTAADLVPASVGRKAAAARPPSSATATTRATRGPAAANSPCGCARRWPAAARSARSSSRPDVKRCTKCGEVKPLDAFNSDSAKRCGLRPACKTCQAAYRAANREKIAATRATYLAANRERDAAQKAAYYVANRERVLARQAAGYAADPAKYAARVKAYRAAHRAEYVARVVRYQTTKIRATPAWANADLVAAYYVLAEVMGRATGVPHHVDHVEPCAVATSAGCITSSIFRFCPRGQHRQGQSTKGVLALAGLGPLLPTGAEAWR